MPRESRARAWARRAVVVAAALASIATSAPLWQIKAEVPSGATQSTLGTRMLIEASQAPLVIGERKENGKSLYFTGLREDTGAWSGHAAYYLPPGYVPSLLYIDGNCANSGGMCSACKPPPGAFLRVTKVEQVAPWSLSVTSDEQTARVGKGVDTASFTVEVRATRQVAPVGFLVGGPDARDPFIQKADSGDAGAGDTQRFTVTWYAHDTEALMPVDLHWKLRASIYGYCRGEGECRPPEGESVQIVSITPK